MSCIKGEKKLLFINVIGECKKEMAPTPGLSRSELLSVYSELANI
jgi:hypothetical protein